MSELLSGCHKGLQFQLVLDAALNESSETVFSKTMDVVEYEIREHELVRGQVRMQLQVSLAKLSYQPEL